MRISNKQNAALITERVINASPKEIFSAFEEPLLLAQWWGPAGFSNTFEEFEFKSGGKWIFVMHGPNGTNYRNESIFGEIVTDEKIVIEHIVKPWYRLTIELSGEGSKTKLKWNQEFENPETAARMRSLGERANEENLDKLEQLLKNKSLNKLSGSEDKKESE